MTREEAIKEAYGIPVNKKQHEALQILIPELRESEDERTRKELIDFFVAQVGLYPGKDRKEHRWLRWLEKQKERGPLAKEEEYILHRIIEYLEDETCPSEWISLLHDIHCLPYEKQKEQQPAEWSEEDKIRLKEVLEVLNESIKYLPLGYGYTKDVRLVTDWLKDLPNRISLQPKQEWSEEDEDMLNDIICDISWERRNTTVDKDIRHYDEELKWLKSLPLNLKKKNEDVAKLCSNELSEEDKENLDNIIWLCENCEKGIENVWIPSQAREIKKLIKSLRPSWKPSEEHMEALTK